MSVGGFQAELVVRAAIDFLERTDGNVTFEVTGRGLGSRAGAAHPPLWGFQIVLEESATTAQKSAELRCRETAQALADAGEQAQHALCGFVSVDPTERAVCCWRHAVCAGVVAVVGPPTSGCSTASNSILSAAGIPQVRWHALSPHPLSSSGAT